MVERLFLAVPWDCLRFVIVVFPDHTHILFLVKLPPCIDIVLIFFFIFWSLGNIGFLAESRIPPKPVLGSVRTVVLSISSH